MPYYPDISTLFIHIPKTGGTSIERYLKKKSRQTLRQVAPHNVALPARLSRISLQHHTYRTIVEFRSVLNVPIDCCIISAVRNPYDRIVSDLIKLKRITRGSNAAAVYTAMKKHIDNGPVNSDNHTLPQHEFISGDDGKLVQSITLFRTESLTRDLRNYGYKDYVGPPESNSYCEYFNADSIALINEHYEKDFDLFGYERF